VIEPEPPQFSEHETAGLLALVAAVSNHRQRDDLFHAIGLAMRGVLPFDTLGISMDGPGPDDLTPYFIEPRFEVPVLRKSQSVVSEVFATGRAIHLRDRLEAAVNPTSLAVLERCGCHCLLALPLVGAHGRVLAALCLMARAPHGFDHLDDRLTGAVAMIIGVALDGCLAHEQVAAVADHLVSENRALTAELASAPSPIGASPSFKDALRQVALVAPTDATVLITGETGTGKEVIARAVHAQSGRAGRSLVKINCAVIPTTLVESELFGHEQGAFTDAGRRRKGRFELADGGTLFLDEVGELPLEMQVKLLRVLQTGEFERVGGVETLVTDVRVIAATNRDLMAMVAAGDFREDLYYRLSVFPIALAPLRDRPEDLAPLVRRFVAESARRHRRPTPVVDEAALAALARHAWPGNVRELENAIERAVIVAVGPRLAIDEVLELSSAPAGAVATDDDPATHVRGIQDALTRAGGRVEGPGGAAALLGVRPSTLRSRMRRLGVTR